MDLNYYLYQQLKREIDRNHLTEFAKCYDVNDYDPTIRYSLLIENAKGSISRQESAILDELVVRTLLKRKTIPKADIDMMVLDEYEKRNS